MKSRISNGIKTKKLDIEELGSVDLDTWLILAVGKSPGKKQLRRWVAGGLFDLWFLDFGDPNPRLFGICSGSQKDRDSVAGSLIRWTGLDTPHPPMLMFAGVAHGVVEAQEYIQRHRAAETN